MRSNRHINKYPYIILGLIHLTMLVVTIYKSPNRKKSVVLLFNYAGFSYLFEYIVAVLCDAYAYKPNFLKQKNLDNIFGSICSQLFYVPVTALFISVFSFGWKVKLIFSLYFALIEKLFILLGSFKNHWWKTRYTFIIIFLSFFINDLWNEQLTKKNPFILFISFFNLIQVTWMNTVYILAVLGKILYGMPPYFKWEEHFKVAPFFGFLTSFVLARWLKKDALKANLKSFTFMLVKDLVLLNMRLLKTFNIATLPIIYIIMITSANKYKKLIYEEIDKEC
ncbi:hypothetical protein [Litchfieldia alkalitelluris]|uniref:hypothetical protein n=1 Tax=Litchfieldia alkalitelluris TaxID=304268 RepID=UPI0009960D35|nr:hypothetical protein [Litchfieldia alkalitelluris]